MTRLEPNGFETAGEGYTCEWAQNGNSESYTLTVHSGPRQVVFCRTAPTELVEMGRRHIARARAHDEARSANLNIASGTSLVAAGLSVLLSPWFWACLAVWKLTHG